MLTRSISHFYPLLASNSIHDGELGDMVVYDSHAPLRAAADIFQAVNLRPQVEAGLFFVLVISGVFVQTLLFVKTRTLPENR